MIIKELKRNKRIKINANEVTLIVLNEFIQGFSVLLTSGNKVAVKPITTNNELNTITIDDMESYLLNSFCKGFDLHETTQFKELLVIADINCELQFINIR